MQKAVVIQGHVISPHRIDLDEPLNEIQGAVEVIVRIAKNSDTAHKKNIFDFIAELPPGNRSKKDIDEQIREERASWGDR